MSALVYVYACMYVCEYFCVYCLYAGYVCACMYAGVATRGLLLGGVLL